MSDGRLLIGQRRYSSWSLRGWLAVRLANLDVEIQVARFVRPGPTPLIEATSPNRLVPYLEHRGAQLWESLAICEYCAEFAPALWPADRIARAHGRSIAAEMHAGFSALRSSLPMNLRTEGRRIAIWSAAQADVDRITEIWRECLETWKGPWLFGRTPTIGDAMYAPVVTRFLTFQPELSAGTKAYCAAVRAHALVAEWYDAAAREPAEWLVESYEQTPTSLNAPRAIAS